MLMPESILRDRYVIETLLRQEERQAICQAHDKQLNTRVMLREVSSLEAHQLRQFEQKALLLAKLDHPALQAVTDFFSEGQNCYVASAAKPGQDLATYLTQQPQGFVTEVEAVRIILPILDALEYLHRQEPPLIHRDLKPSNIWLTEDGQICLLNCSLAPAYDPVSPMPVAARGINPGFSPLEQYGAGRIDSRADLYALGATFYVLLGGRGRLLEAPDRVNSEALTSLQRFNPSVSPQLERIIGRLLALRPQDRYQNVKTLRRDLQQPRQPAQPIQPKLPPVVSTPVTVPLPKAASDSPSALEPAKIPTLLLSETETEGSVSSGAAAPEKGTDEATVSAAGEATDSATELSLPSASAEATSEAAAAEEKDSASAESAADLAPPSKPGKLTTFMLVIVALLVVGLAVYGMYMAWTEAKIPVEPKSFIDPMVLLVYL